MGTIVYAKQKVGVVTRATVPLESTAKIGHRKLFVSKYNIYIDLA